MFRSSFVRPSCANFPEKIFLKNRKDRPQILSDSFGTFFKNPRQILPEPFMQRNGELNLRSRRSKSLLGAAD